MNSKKLIVALVFMLALNLLVVPTVMAEESKKETEEEVYTLDELVVVASKHPEKLSESAVSVEVIDQEDIEQKNAQNVADLLRDVGSIQINDQGGIAGKKTISIRGSKSEQVLILIDGQPINSRQNGQVDLSQFIVANIKKIEVLKGPGSVLYGANALGGVINITTKSGIQEPITELKLGFGSYNTKNYILTHQGSTNKLSYNLSVTKKKSNGHRENSDLNQNNLFTKFNYKINKHSNMILSLKHNDSDKGIPGPTNSSTPNAKQDDEDTNINFQWKRKTEIFDQKLNIYHNQHENIFDNPDQFEYSKHDTNKSGIDFNQTNYHKNHTITYGLEFKRNKIDSTDNGEHDTLNKAFFIQDNWRMNKKIKINLGGRYDNHEQFGSEFNPRLGTVYTINSNINLHASIGKAYRTPTFNELYWPYQDYGSWGIYKGNPNLEPESAVAYETGIRYMDETLKCEFNLFKKDVEDLIAWDEGDDGVNRPYNINSASVLGTEINLNKKLTSRFSTNLNYTYLNAKDEKTDERLHDKNYHNFNLGLNYNTEEISSSLNGRLVAGRTDELPSYFVVDAKLSKKINREVEATLKVNNLFDREYQVKDGFPMPGRNFMLEVSKKF